MKVSHWSALKVPAVEALAVVALSSSLLGALACSSDAGGGTGGATQDGTHSDGVGGLASGGGDTTGSGSVSGSGSTSSGGGGSGGSETGGAGGDDLPEAPSAGCDGSATPPTGAQSITVGALERTYIVSLPDDYDPAHAYPLVFVYHGRGGSGEGAMSEWYLGSIEAAGGSPAIFLYPDGLSDGEDTGWPNTDGRDVAFFDALLTEMGAGYCVDENRVFSTGHSFGGMMSHTLGCQRADVLRGIAPIAGSGWFAGSSCGGPVAAWGAHGDPDGVVEYSAGVDAMARVLETNGCDDSATSPVEPTDYCVAYACDVGFPVTWCTHGEDHNVPDFAGEAIKAFIDGF